MSLSWTANSEQIAYNLKGMMLARGLTTGTLSEGIGLQRVMVRRWLYQGARPNIQTLKKLCTFLNVKRSQILREVPQRILDRVGATTPREWAALFIKAKERGGLDYRVWVGYTRPRLRQSRRPLRARLRDRVSPPKEPERRGRLLLVYRRHQDQVMRGKELSRRSALYFEAIRKLKQITRGRWRPRRFGDRTPPSIFAKGGDD